MRSFSTLRPWLRRTERFWDFLLGRSRSLLPLPFKSRQPRVEQLEDRVVPVGRPLPYPVIAVGPGEGAGLVKMFDADTGAELINLVPFANTFTGGIRVAIDDFSNDGYPDLAMAAGPGGGPHVRILDGKTGQQMSGPLGNFFAYDPNFLGGVQLSSGDISGDGLADLVTAADTGGGPHVRVFDGRSGELLYNFFAFEPEFHGGVRIAIGDLAGKGRPQLVIGAGPGGAPRVRILNLDTMQPIPGPLGDFFAFDLSERGGVQVATGKVTADDRVDLVTGAGVGAAPVVCVYDGASGALATTLTVFGPADTGGVQVGTSYVDFDAQADVVAGTGVGSQPRVRTLSGATGQPVGGWAGDFMPGVGSVAGGVNLAAGNDPLIDTITSTVSSKLTTAGSTESVQFDATFTATVVQSAIAANYQYATPSNTVHKGSMTSDSAVFDLYFPPGEESSLSEYGSIGVIGEDESEDYLHFAAPYQIGLVGLPPNFATKDSCPTDGSSKGRVRYSDGAFSLPVPDFGSGGFELPWGQDRAWTNDQRYTIRATGGNGWVNSQQPHLVWFDGGLVYIADASTAMYFDGQGTPDGNGNYATYLARHGSVSAITYNSSANTFALDDGTGTLSNFVGFGGTTLGAGRQGALVSRQSPGGLATAVVSRNTLGHPTEYQRSATVSGTTITERYEMTYLPGTSPSQGTLWTVTLSRKVGSGSWTTVRKVEYEYYTPGESYGNTGDLKRATVTDGTNVLDQTYYRYYTSNTSPGYTGGLKYAFGAAAYAQLKAAVGGTDASVDVASDGTLSPYADQYLEYDSSKRVTKLTASAAGCSLCTGGQGTMTYTYTTSSNSDGYNSWAMKTVETLPDGNTNTVYTNAYAQVMLQVHEDTATGTKWRTFHRYDSSGRVVLTAEPSAVTGHNDTYADLMNYVSGNATYLADSAGLVSATAYYSSTTATDTSAGGAAGFEQSTAIRRGETGTDVPQAEWTYFRKTAGGATASPVATETVYRNTNGTGGQTTSYAYTWHSGTTQPATIAMTLPTVTTAKNGPNTATTSTVAYDVNGRAIWMKDGGGFLSYTEYDLATGGVTKTIADVNTSQTSDFANLPSGWSTPSGGGLHLIATAEVDHQGRTTKSTDPLGHVSYTVYNDPSHEVRLYAGWDSTTNLPTGPTVVSREDRAGRYLETLTMSATPSVSSGRPTGTESISSLQSLSRAYQNEAGQTVSTDGYFNLSGLTYSTRAYAL